MMVNKALKWAMNYFLKAQTSRNEFYGEVGRRDFDHDYWGRPENMTMPRPAFKIDTANPGKLASRSFSLTSKSTLCSGKSTACAKCLRHSHF
jgi:hypothetical protein